MDRTERIALLHRLLSANRFGLATERLMREAGCGRSTLYRDLEVLRDGLGAPLENDGKKPCMWFYTRPSSEDASFELPGLWLRAEELFVVVLSGQMFSQSGGGSWFGEAMWRFQPRIEKMFGDYAQHLGRLRVVRVNARQVDDAVFRIVADSVLKRRQLAFDYAGRDSGEASSRVVSPQRLTHYRDNWYLEAFDEAAVGMRTFALERLRAATLQPDVARDVAQLELDALREAGYGIYSGVVTGIATLRFSARAARWVAEECWHPRQQQRRLEDGRLDLDVPYANSRELLMDVLRHGPDAQVLGPPELRAEIEALLVATLAAYRGAAGGGVQVERGAAVRC